jgi:hypothetical protein
LWGGLAERNLQADCQSARRQLTTAAQDNILPYR